MRRTILLALLLATLAGFSHADVATPLVIAHRGASGYLPEHTLAGYELAIRMGADFIEPDLQLTQDGVLVAMHDDSLARTTNVANRFAPRHGGYKVADFSLSEIKTLAVQPTGTGQSSHAGFAPSVAEPFQVPTFQQVIDLAQQQSLASGRSIGIYPEAKQSDPAMENGILATLARNHYGQQSKVFIQSFSDSTLRSLRRKQTEQNNPLPLVLLGVAITGADGVARLGVVSGNTVTPLTLQEVASFSEGIGVSIHRPAYAVDKSFIAQAHAAGLQVHGWTFAKADPTAAAAEFQQYLEMGMDGVFANYPDLAVTARKRYLPPK
nr:glycerophosphodiester phosphodiesterase family protein [uncultured Albidiferax sp.]